MRKVIIQRPWAGKSFSNPNYQVLLNCTSSFKQLGKSIISLLFCPRTSKLPKRCFMILATRLQAWCSITVSLFWLYQRYLVTRILVHLLASMLTRLSICKAQWWVLWMGLWLQYQYMFHSCTQLRPMIKSLHKSIPIHTQLNKNTVSMRYFC